MGYYFQDENVRVSLCDNQHWLPVVVLLGLVSCSVPSTLKSELLQTLAAFAKSPEIAASLWQSIEVSQVSVNSACYQHERAFRLKELTPLG